MFSSNAFLNLKKFKGLADWKLLLFLVLFLNVKLAIKIPAIALIYLLQFNFKFGFSFKNSRLPVFYLLAIAIAILNWIIGLNYLNLNYNLVLLAGTGFWVLCILAMHQVKLFVDNNDTDTIHRTIVAFFIINAALSLGNLALIMIETGSINPYTFQGEHQKYFLGTGDYIRGITFDTSTTNAVLNALGVLYFLTKRSIAMLFVCMTVMLLTGSNCINVILLACFAILFIFKSTRDQKSLIAICIALLVLFMGRISPQNNTYVVENFKRDFHLNKPHPPAPIRPHLYLPITRMPDSLLTSDEKRGKIAQRYIDSMYVVNHPELLDATKKKAIPIKKSNDGITRAEGGRILIPKANINDAPYQHVIDTSAYQKQLLTFIDEHKASLPLSANGVGKLSFLPGKIMGWMQTFHFLQQHPLKIFTGNGMGNFSSKLAFRVSGLGFAGGYPQKYAYIDPDFLSNHLDIYLDFFSKKTDLHSLSNNPDSVYDQLFAEYGLLGFIAFLVYYIGYFMKHYKQLSYGLPMLIMVLALFFVGYWFEQLSVLIFFELLLLLNIKANSTQITLKYA